MIQLNLSDSDVWHLHPIEELMVNYDQTPLAHWNSWYIIYIIDMYNYKYTLNLALYDINFLYLTAPYSLWQLQVAGIYILVYK